MAFTVTVVDKTVFGNKRAILLDVTADAVSGVVAVPGLNVVDCISATQVSMVTMSLIKFHPNVNAASAASNGNIMVSGTTSGDRFFLVVYGH